MSNKEKRRHYGAHLTSTILFKKYILPDIKDQIYQYTWVDLFCGEGNLILPILELIPKEKRNPFFANHIRLYDIQESMINKARKHAIHYGIDPKLAHQHIKLQDTLKHYPEEILQLSTPTYHITNPPYLYLGYIRKQKNWCKEREYFNDSNQGYQDLYQIALINDLRQHLHDMVYIIPSNFLFGTSGTNKIRDDFFPYYDLTKMITLEKKVFEHTGYNVSLCFFKRKSRKSKTAIIFKGKKIKEDITERTYELLPENHYRAGSEFETFIQTYKAMHPLKIDFYLMKNEIETNYGSNTISLMDANGYSSKTKAYQHWKTTVNQACYDRITSNILWIRTVDSGSQKNRAGLYIIKESFQTDGIVVTKSTYRTHPIPLFITPRLCPKDQLLLKDYFNLILEYLRELDDSEFMTTYKYSNCSYTRKYLGLLQVRKIIDTFPLFDLEPGKYPIFEGFIQTKDIAGLMNLMTDLKKETKVSYHPTA